MSDERKSDSPANPAREPSPRQRSLARRLLLVAGIAIIGWLAIAYLLMPSYWKHYAKKHPSLEDIPGITHTGLGTEGDPLNVALVGTKQEVMKIFVAARWYPANPLSLKSCLEIAEATVLKRPYDEAPVSSLYLFGRVEDLAFEKPVGDDPRQRHHVRLWQTDKIDPDGRPIWIGAAMYDQHVGLSRETGQITHVTNANIDAERDFLFADLTKTGDIEEKTIVPDYHKVHEGKNGGGDPWHTDGALWLGVISPGK